MKKLLILICTVLLVFPMVTGCHSSVPDDENTLEIELYKAGYGTEFLDKLAEAYMAKNPDVKIHINATSEESLIRTHLPSGPNSNTVDLYLQGDSYFDLMSEEGGVTYGGVQYEKKIADLTDVYNAVIPGEGITVKEKMFSDYVNYHNVGEDGKDRFYQFPWAAGIGGITYNYNMFHDNGWEIPNTTDELFSLCQQIVDADLKFKGKKIYPFIFTLEDSYWDMAFMSWWAQYDTVEGFNRFWKGQYYDEGTEAYKFGPNIMLSKGKEECLKVLDRILCIDKSKSGASWAGESAYTDPDSVKSFKAVQTKYYEGGSAMMVNGDWLENEARPDFGSEIDGGEVDIRYMPLPVISALGEKFGISDSQLSEGVRYIRGGKTGAKPSLDETVLNQIEKACNVNQTLGVNHNAVIPCYATARETAKDFLVFMASDEALKIYMETTRGAILPFRFDVKAQTCYNGLTQFQTSKLALMENSQYVFHQSKHPLFYRGGVTPFSNLKVSPEANLFNVTNYKSSAVIHQENYQYVYNNWDMILRNSGIVL